MENSTIRMITISALIILTTGSPAVAEENERPVKPAQTQEPESNKQVQAKPYIPPAPVHATPHTRVATGGTRSADLKFPSVTLLVPDHVSHTVKAQPIVYWHISETTKQPTVLTLSINDEINPLLELLLTSPVDAGIHELKFSDHAIQLQEGKIYEWSVSINERLDAPSAGDLIAKAFIERVPSTDEIKSAEESNDLFALSMAYAQEGLWYDAFAVVSTPLPISEQRQKIEALRKSMLNQVGINLGSP